MKKILSLMHVSLDGFVSGPKDELDWVKLDDHVFGFIDTFVNEADTGLYGPKTFRMMESHWPGVLKAPNVSDHELTHARWYEKASKIVFSRTLDQLDGGSARLVKDNVAEAVTSLKKAGEKNAIIFGSPRLVHSFMQLDLIDEYLLILHPVILGAGVSLSANLNARIDLELIDSTEFNVGAVGLHYKKSVA